MRIGNLRLDNFRGIRHLDIPLDPRLTVLVGVNGAGKSSILDAVAVMLSWVVARVKSQTGSGRKIRELDIMNGASASGIQAFADKPFGMSWRLARVRRAHSRSERGTELAELSEYAETIRREIAATGENCSIPLFAYYPVNRSVLDIPLRIRTQHDFGLLEAWDEALTSAANFRSFFEWFRNREDLENEHRAHGELFEPETIYPDPQLEAVRAALASFLPDFEDFSVRRRPLRMIVRKHKQEVRVDQLSDGEKCLIALVADIARRLAIANPTARNPLDGEGIVLIDEVDLHLHPAWQRMVLPKLQQVFSGCQFLVSTHSPQALGEVAPNQVRLLTQDENNEISCDVPSQSEGLTSNEILDELMRSEGMPQRLSQSEDAQLKINELFRLIDKEEFAKARSALEELKGRFHGDTPELVEAMTLIDFLDEDLERGD